MLIYNSGSSDLNAITQYKSSSKRQSDYSCVNSSKRSTTNNSLSHENKVYLNLLGFKVKKS